MARMNFARSVCDMRGHGPRSKAFRAASTARLMSASWASATLAYNSSVAELITSIFFVLDGFVHLPSMKNMSGFLMGAWAFMVACLREFKDIGGAFGASAKACCVLRALSIYTLKY